MTEKNYDEYIVAAKEQLKNEKNNPTLLLVLSKLHSGITHYKLKAERLEKELVAAKEDMKCIAQGIDGCRFCKNVPPKLVCEDVDYDCKKCTAECSCQLCAVNGTFNFEWKDRL